MNKLVKWRPESLEAKIERWKSHSPIVVPNAVPIAAPKPTPIVPGPASTRAHMEWAPPHDPPPVTTESVVNLPRICAVEKKLWCARYRRDPGEKHFRYLRSTVAESRQCVVEYTPERWRTMPPGFVTGIEDCPHCGGYTMDGYTGAVFDPDCGLWCCFGLTSRNGWFICQCGSEGPLGKYFGKRHGMR